jgi:hypothetical protein
MMTEAVGRWKGSHDKEDHVEDAFFVPHHVTNATKTKAERNKPGTKMALWLPETTKQPAKPSPSSSRGGEGWTIASLEYGEVPLPLKPMTR